MSGRRALRLRPLILCAAALLSVGWLGSCSRPRQEVDGCRDSAVVDVPTGGITPAAAAGQPSPVAEALWVADASGTLRAFDGRTDTVSAYVDIGRAAIPPALTAGGGLIWAFRHDGSITVVDPAAARVTAHAEVVPARPGVANRLHYAHGALWIGQPGRLWRVSPSGTVTSTPLPADFAPTVVAASENWLWLGGGRRLVRVDPATRTVTEQPELPLPNGVAHLLGTRGGLWAVPPNRPEIWALDPDTGAVNSSVRIADGELVNSMVGAGAEVWATGNCGYALHVTGTEHPVIHRVKISDGSADLPAAAAVGSLWVADEVRSELIRIDLATGGILARIPVAAADPDDPAFAVVAGQRSLWLVGLRPPRRVLRVDPATNQVLAPPSSIRELPSVSAVVAAPPA